FRIYCTLFSIQTQWVVIFDVVERVYLSIQSSCLNDQHFISASTSKQIARKENNTAPREENNIVPREGNNVAPREENNIEHEGNRDGSLTRNISRLFLSSKIR